MLEIPQGVSMYFFVNGHPLEPFPAFTEKEHGDDMRSWAEGFPPAGCFEVKQGVRFNLGSEAWAFEP
ncbi:unnamed protein product, partial [Discosporangium mesarthrocarpum]